MATWFEDLRSRRSDFVRAAQSNHFEAGIWRASVDKYAESTHFILELLQNAEDQRARNAVLRVETNRITFEHDGTPFTEQDVENITGIGNTEKPSQANKIGCFGIGFKSVFVATDRPEVHSWLGGQPFSFAIRNLVLPELLTPSASIRRGWTRFELPIKSTIQGTMFQSISERMSAWGPRVLLFLRSIERLEWSSAGIGEVFTRENDRDEVVILRRASIGSITTRPAERYLTFSRELSQLSLGAASVKESQVANRDLSVSIAFRLNLEGQIAAEEQRARLSVFFETQEETGLFFLVHGPFLLTDNRANIKRGEPLNDYLIDEVGELVAASLLKIRDEKLLTRDFLGVLPSEDDFLARPWTRIRERIIEAMKSQPLVPTGSGSHDRAHFLRRGPASLRALLSDEVLAVMFGVGGAKWAVAGLRHQRVERFLDDLGIPELSIDDFVDQLAARLALGPGPARSWIASLSDSEMQRLYLLLRDARPSKLQRLRTTPIIRLEDKRHVVPREAFFAPDKAKGDERYEIDLPLVSGAILRHPERSDDIRELLRSLGVTEVDDTAYVRAILERFYSKLRTAEVTLSLHRTHIARFVALWQKTKDVSIFRSSGFLLDEGKSLTLPERLYMDSPYEATGMRRVYRSDQNRVTRSKAVWPGYAQYRINGFNDFICAVGVRRRIPIRVTNTWSHPQRAYLHGAGGTFRLETGTDVDYVMENLEKLLELSDPEISRPIWNTMSEAPGFVLHAVYQANRSAETRTTLSSLALLLRDAAWIPNKSGRLQKPCEMTYGALASGFAVGSDREWLDAIEFAGNEKLRSTEHQEKIRAAQLIGAPDELLENLLALPNEVQADLWQKLLVLARNQNAEFIKEALPNFPEHESSSPARRAEKTAARARDAIKKGFAKRERQVRIRDPWVDEQTRTYLRDMYTNDEQQMICQVCRDEMPFRLADGSPFFVAVECASGLSYDCPENHLALCPVCAAKYLYANTTDPSQIIRQLVGGSSLLVNVRLADKDATIRFVRDHADDLAIVVRALSSSRDGDISVGT